MKSLTKVFLFMLLILLAGFTIINNEESKSGEPADSEKAISVNAADNAEENSIIDYIDKGEMVASWYGPKFHGKVTANGEVFDQSAFTAAHKKLRFGTLLKVTNPRNNKSIIVRINDRGPYISGRQLDLSKVAAQTLGIAKRGVARVKVEEISLRGVNLPVVPLN